MNKIYRYHLFNTMPVVLEDDHIKINEIVQIFDDVNDINLNTKLQAIQGTNISINSSGVISSIIPVASTSVSGGIIVGNNLTISSGVLSGLAPPNLAPYRLVTDSYTKLEVDTKDNNTSNYILELLEVIPYETLSVPLKDVIPPISKTRVEELTGVNGWRLVRFLPPTSTAWFSGNDNIQGTRELNHTTRLMTQEWTVLFGTFNEYCFSTLNFTNWLYCTKDAVNGANYGNLQRPIIRSSTSPTTAYTANWYNRSGRHEDPWISLGNHPTGMLYGENSVSEHNQFIGNEGMCVWVRSSTDTQTTIQPITIDAHYKYISFPNTGANQTLYNITFNENTEVQLLLLDGTRYILTNPFNVSTGSLQLIVGKGGSLSSFSGFTTGTNGITYGSGFVSNITGTDTTYNTPQVIIKYKYTKSNEGYLNYTLDGWKVNDIVGDTNLLIQDTSNYILELLEVIPYETLSVPTKDADAIGNITPPTTSVPIIDIDDDYKYITFVNTNTEPSLIAFYKFDGNYNDSSGNNHHLINNGASLQSTHVISGQAVDFDNADFLTFPSTINPYTIWNGNGITFAFWTKISSFSGTWSRLIDFQPSTNTTSGLLISQQNTANILHIQMDGSQANINLTFANNEWRHISFSVSTTGVWTIYINGVNQNVSVTRIIPNITYNLRYINKSVYSINGNWDGQMDNFRIYNRVLSQEDVSSLNTRYSTLPSQIYTINFPEETEVQLLLLDDTKYIETAPFLTTGSNNIVVGVPSTFNTITTTTNSIAYNTGVLSNITGTNITYNTPQVIIRYKYTKPIIIQVPNEGYLNYTLDGWKVSDIVGVTGESDIRIKRDIVDIDDVEGLEKILLTQPKKYKYIDTSRGETEVIGFIAQDILQIIPQAVDFGERQLPNDGETVQDFHYLDKAMIFTLNVCATQELHRMILRQQTVIDGLLVRIEALES